MTLAMIFFLMALACLVMLLWGLIKPTKAFLGAESTRSKVAKVYGFGFLALFIAFIAAAPVPDKAESPTESTTGTTEPIAPAANSSVQPAPDDATSIAEQAALVADSGVQTATAPTEPQKSAEDKPSSGMRIIVFILLIAGAWIAISNHFTKKKLLAQQAALLARRTALLAKYGDEEVVDKIMASQFWQGQTPEQLTDSLGSPADIDQKVMKTKTREVWKYHETGVGRYALRITIEEGIVVGWDDKT